MPRSVSPSASDQAVEDQLRFDPNAFHYSHTSNCSDTDEHTDDEIESATLFHPAQEESDSNDVASNSPENASSGRDQNDDDASMQALCRICLDGPQSDSEGGESLGRLISPCRCKGTMKYVHATCLDRWRSMSARTSSIIACDQCGSPYRFRKSKFVGIATSPALLFALSFFLFLLLIWTVGLIATFWIDVYDARSAQHEQSKQASSWWPWRGSRDVSDQVYADPWLDSDVDLTYSNYWSYGGLAYEPFAYVKLVKEAVRQFASGEAVEAVKDVVGLTDAGLDESQVVQTDEDPEEGFWLSLKREWMYGDGGLWAGQSAGECSASTTVTAQAAESTHTAVQEKYDARHASPYDPTDKGKGANSRRDHRRTGFSLESTSSASGWLNKILLQFSLGFSLVGILSFVNLLIGASFLGPFNLHNFGLGRSFARMTSSNRRNGGRSGGQDGVNVASIVLVLLVIIGVVRALHLVYKAVRSLSRRFLSRLEEAIVDWQGEDDAPTREHPIQQNLEPENLEI